MNDEAETMIFQDIKLDKADRILAALVRSTPVDKDGNICEINYPVVKRAMEYFDEYGGLPVYVTKKEQS